MAPLRRLPPCLTCRCREPPRSCTCFRLAYSPNLTAILQQPTSLTHTSPPLYPFRGNRVHPCLTFKDAVLFTPLGPPSIHPPLHPPAFVSHPALPPHPPKYLLNPSLRGRCFWCFEKGHRAAQCREPRRCLLCMRIGHPASRCDASLSPRRMEPSIATVRPSSVIAFLPPSPPPHHGQPSLSGRVARVEGGVEGAGLDLAFIKESLPSHLAATSEALLWITS